MIDPEWATIYMTRPLHASYLTKYEVENTNIFCIKKQTQLIK